MLISFVIEADDHGFAYLDSGSPQIPGGSQHEIDQFIIAGLLTVVGEIEMNNFLSLAYVEVFYRVGQVQGFFCPQPFFLGIDNLFYLYAFAFKKLLRFLQDVQPGRWYTQSSLVMDIVLLLLCLFKTLDSPKISMFGVLSSGSVYKRVSNLEAE